MAVETETSHRRLGKYASERVKSQLKPGGMRQAGEVMTHT